jgi:hypothetical protein
VQKLSFLYSKSRVILAALLLGICMFVQPSLAFTYNFNTEGTLVEAFPMSASSSPYWWVSSGAYLNIYEGRGHTTQGNLPANNQWRVLLSQSNPRDTDNGYHPQNIFRLVTKQSWQNMRQEAYFKIHRDNLSPSEYRAASNGLLLFNRYQDQDNLYYTGVRVDGTAIIKKKQNGVYTTLAQNPVFPGTYNRDTNPSLLPKNTWIGVRSELRNNADGSVTIKVYVDKSWRGVWELVAQATDTQNPITQGGRGGIRTDFMDVTFDAFKADNI